MSSNTRSATSSSPVSLSSRIPGVSIRHAPWGRVIRVRWVVVWRPRESRSRTAPVRILLRPIRVLVRVDLPAPEEPTSTTVRPLPSQGARAATLSGSLALTLTTGTPPASMSLRRARSAPASSQRSSLVSTSTGSAPLARTSTR